MSNLKNGRAPLSQKKSPGSSFKDRFNDRLGIPDSLVSEIKGKDLEFRWVDAKKLYQNQGYHPNGWEAYKRTSPTTDFKNGNDPDGIVRRGSLILAVRSKDMSQEHREFLQEKANRAVGADRSATQSRTAKELRAMGGRDVQVIEGDDEDEDT